MAGPLTWELAEELAPTLGPLVLLTGHPDTLAKGNRPNLELHASVTYSRGSFARRLWSWARYVIHAFFWLWRWPRHVPLLLFSNPPLLIWLGWVMKKLRGTPFAVMVHDVHPDVIVRLGHLRETAWPIRLWRWLNRQAYREASLVMTLTPGMARVLAKQFDCEATPAGTIPVIYPWADTSRIVPQPKESNPFAIAHGQCTKFTIIYSGNMGLGHDLETMLGAAELLQADDRFHFMFIGSGPKWTKVQSRIQESQLSNTTLLGWQPEDELPNILTTADIAVVSLEAELADLAIPSKTFYSLAAGSPLIVLCEANSDLEQLVRDNNCGWRISSGDVDRFVNLLHQLQNDKNMLAEKKKAARAAAESISTRQGNSHYIGELLIKYLNVANRPAFDDGNLVQHHASQEQGQR